MAHRLGEFYHVPHGLAIAAVFTGVLRASRPYCDLPLAALAKACALGDTADDFLCGVDKLIADAGIDLGTIKILPEDLGEIVRKAQDEARVTGYPKPFSDDALRQLIESILL